MELLAEEAALSPFNEDGEPTTTIAITPLQVKRANCARSGAAGSESYPL
jgi:hypothetical protein